MGDETIDSDDLPSPLEWSPAIALNMLKRVRRSTRPTIISIEGIPGSRKSDIMNILAQKYEDSLEVVICKEPLHDTQMQM
jgi:hypothetical protein